jgi:hypothetical protein
VLLLVAALAVPAQAAADRMPVSAGITSFTPACAGIALTAQGSDPYSISEATVTLQALVLRHVPDSRARRRLAGGGRRHFHLRLTGVAPSPYGGRAYSMLAAR